METYSIPSLTLTVSWCHVPISLLWGWHRNSKLPYKNFCSNM